MASYSCASLLITVKMVVPTWGSLLRRAIREQEEVNLATSARLLSADQDLIGLQPSVLAIPLVEARLANPVLTAEAGGLLASFMLSQNRKDLRFCVLALTHVSQV
jgi:hypothetical protein